MDPKLQTMMRAYQRARSEGDDARARRYGQMVAQYRNQTGGFEATTPAPERYEVEHFGHTVEVRRGQESEDLAAFRQSDAFYNTIDHSMNAHAGARAAVGSLDKPEDRLATLRGYYDDVVPYGDDNFMFIHPDTGRPTLYNSIDGVSALDHLKDFGSDVASLSRDWVITAAGGGGAVGGAILGGAVGAPSGPGAIATATAGGIAGAGLGSAAGAGAFDLIANLLGVRVDTRTAGEVAADLAIEGALGAAGQGVGGAVAKGAGRLMRGRAATGARNVRRMRRAGITPPDVGTVTGGRASQLVQSAVDNTPGGAAMAQAKAELTQQEVRGTLKRIIGQLGTPSRTPFAAGEAMEVAADGAEKAFRQRSSAAYEAAFDAIGRDTPVQLSRTKAFADELTAIVERNPRLGREHQAILTRARNFLDEADQGLAFEDFRWHRSRLLEEVRRLERGASAAGQNTRLMKTLSDALQADMLETAANAPGARKGAADLLRQADADYARFFEHDMPILKKIMDTQAAERVERLVTGTQANNVRDLMAIKRNFTDEEFGVISATALDRLGLAMPGKQNAAGDAFSAQTFITRWSRNLSPEAKDILFGKGGVRQELDNLADVLNTLNDAGYWENASRTASNMISGAQMGAIGFGVIDVFSTGGVGTATAAIGGGVVAPHVAGRLLKNQAFVRWMATPPDMIAQRGITQHLARLYAVAEAAPALRAEVHQFAQAFNAQLGEDPQATQNEQIAERPPNRRGRE